MTAMSDQELLDRAERAARGIALPDGRFDDLLRRRDRKRRNQRITAGVVGIAVFVAAVWVVTTGGSFNRTEQPAIKPTPTPEPSLTAPEAYLIDLNIGEMTPLPESIGGSYGSPQGGYTVSPDGTMVAYTSPDDTGTRQVFIANLDGTDIQQVTHDRREAAALDWSPDGAAIVYDAMEKSERGDIYNIFVLDLATGEITRVTNEKPRRTCSAFCPGGADAPQFSPDGASIIYDLHRGDSGVWIVPVTGGKSVRLVGGGENGVDAAIGTLSPDGSTLAVGCSGRLEGICIADADGTNLRVLVSVSGPPWFGPRWSPDGTRIAYTNANPNGDKVFVADVATGETTFVAEGVADDWLDDHTLIVECACR
jgi:Tol biopolymer transport system component